MIHKRQPRHLSLNLQLFAQEKTEKATAKKRQKARQEGQVLKSMEFNSAVVLLATFISIKLFFPYMLEQLSGFFREIYRMWGSQDFVLNARTSHQLYFSTIKVSFMTVLPIAGIAVVSGVAANLLQSGFIFTTKPLKPNISALNPINGIKRMFGVRSLVELVKSLVKVAIVGYIAYTGYKSEFNKFPQLLDMNIRASSLFIGRLILNMAFKIAVCLLIFSGFDYWYQWWEYERSLKMTKQEVKEELKQTEGDPKVKAAIRRKQQQMSVARMMQAVPKADVVITNPTHYAVALKYDADTMSAPEVVAKGQDYLAQRIKQVAKEHGVVLVENKPLAQALYNAVEIGESIPAELYQAVAEVLAFVYKLKGRI
ncbi:flagellar biosynthesis protein FlhB [Thermincola potens]|uniref:Flagellar biosynthetic protein FlhB n=1 Tax=Thermincola potens (strain JR) TaxID=635013 RepID=D5XFF5_THEPJ|nr:flagellar biosynthesis protein FlhB [Thermincola potens]ADG82376.1 flagellar biosynthetic protein FlhB [Thermincola potens JR]